MFNTERIISWLCAPPVISAKQYNSSYDLWILSPVKLSLAILLHCFLVSEQFSFIRLLYILNIGDKISLLCQTHVKLTQHVYYAFLNFISLSRSCSV